MIGDMFNNNKRRDVCTREGQKMYRGKKYAQDPATGYYVCTTGKKRQRLHVAIWEHEHGMAVPPGCVIHHKDWCKTNNSVENLTCVTVEDHERIHNHKKDETGIIIFDMVTSDVVYSN
jgi:hypothetical protein